MNPAPTVSELNAARPDSLEGLIQFVLSVPASHEAAIFYAALFAGAIGFIASWWVKYSIAKTVDDCIWAYFFKVHTRRTMGVLGTYLGTVIFSITTGAFDSGSATAGTGEIIKGVFAGWQNVFSVCITAAMAADGTLNKGTQGAWSDQQRAVERAKQDTAKEAQQS